MAAEPATVDQLQAELRELRALYAASREEQAATHEILRAIASSSLDLQHVLGEIARAARRVGAADDVIIHGVSGETMWALARAGANPLVPAIHSSRAAEHG